MRNVKQIKLILTEEGLKKFNIVPTFANLLHANQRSGLKVGENTLQVNHYIYSTLQRVCGYDKTNMQVIG